MKKLGSMFSILTKRKEARLANEEWMVTLRDGTKMDGRDAVVNFKVLQSVHSSDPELLAKLYRIANGELVPDTEFMEKYENWKFSLKGIFSGTLTTCWKLSGTS